MTAPEQGVSLGVNVTAVMGSNKDTMNTSRRRSSTMSFEVDRGLVTLFGSETRVRTLAPLASAYAPMTAYRIASISGAQRTKIYAELRRLAKAGVVRGRANRAVWELIDPDVRRIFRRRMRVSWWEDWMNNPERRARSGDEAMLRSARRDFFRRVPRPTSVPRSSRSLLSEFERRPEEGRTLARLGFPRSSRKKGRR